MRKADVAAPAKSMGGRRGAGFRCRQAMFHLTIAHGARADGVVPDASPGRFGKLPREARRRFGVHLMPHDSLPRLVASVHPAYRRLPLLVVAFAIALSFGSLVGGFRLDWTVSLDSVPAPPGSSPAVAMATNSSVASAPLGVVPVPPFPAA